MRSRASGPMHPAYSVIFFTTASGAGYGLLFWVGLWARLGLLPASPAFGFTALALALALITAGLLSSAAHLGRPERAWRAFSQWRSSWLSREGVAAVLTYIPAGILGVGWVFYGRLDGVIGIAGLLAAAMSLVVVWCTGMIYASLPTVRAWHHPLVAPIYVVLALGTGALLLNLILPLFGARPTWAPWLAIVTLCAGWLLKTTYWAQVDSAARTYTIEDATGLGRFGRVAVLEPPHTQPNFVMREMGYQVGRNHADVLRRAAAGLLFVLPAFLSGLMLASGTPVA